MAVRIARLDWRSDDALIASQEALINGYLSTRTVEKIFAEDEYLYALNVTDVVLPNPWKIKLFNGTRSIVESGIPATQTLIESFISGKTLVEAIPTGEGTFVVVYHD